jgi:sugar transferase EpsL
MKIKRVLDFVFCLLFLIILIPVIFILSLSVFVFIGHPILFYQTRPGVGGKPFVMYKFRTMTNKTDSQGLLLPDAQRLSSFGKFLRASSLDELPELWNVIKGDMSLVGPRPLLIEYLPLYSDEQSRRHLIRPGITGWAQINGRNAISWEEKFKLDVWYVNNQSFWLDLKILFLTIKKILIREGISADGHATIEKFKGSGL